MDRGITTKQTDLRFSIVTPVYNGEKTIKRTLRSVLAQKYPVYEHIVVDGRSSDGTLACLESFRKYYEDRGIRYTVISEKDEGIYDAMNKGIRLCTGDLVGIINADDWYENNATLVMRKLFFREHFDMAYADIRMHNGDSTFIKKAKNPPFVSSRHWNHPTQFVRREIYNEKLYDNRNVFGDLDFLLWLHRRKKKIVCINKVLADFTMGGASNNRKKLSQVMERIRMKAEIYHRYHYGWPYYLDAAAIEVAKAVLGKA